MTTRLDGELKRELRIGKQDYTVKFSATGFTLALKGNRKGLEIRWSDLVSGDAALATALKASLTANIRPKATQQQKVTAAPAAVQPKSPSRRAGDTPRTKPRSTARKLTSKGRKSR